MWNLVMNLPGKNGFFQEPFLDGNGTQGRRLVNGERYEEDDVANLFSGVKPFEASSLYSDMLKNTIKSCLRYRQENRTSFADLKKITAKYAYHEEMPVGSSAHGQLVIKVAGRIVEFSIGRVFAPSGDKSKKKKRRREP